MDKCVQPQVAAGKKGKWLPPGYYRQTFYDRFYSQGGEDGDTASQRIDARHEKSWLQRWLAKNATACAFYPVEDRAPNN